MTNSHGHLTIVDKRPPQFARQTVGRIYNIVQDPEPETKFSRVNLEPEDVEDEVVETKVVKGRRGRRPVVTASEVAETE